MKLFAILLVGITLIRALEWIGSTTDTVALPSAKQLNEMVGLEGVANVPLWLTDSGNH